MARIKPPPRADRKGSLDLKKQHHYDVEFARLMLLNHGAVHPMYAVHTPGYTKVIAANWQTEKEKTVAQRLIALMAAGEGAVGITFIGEAWLRSVTPLPGESNDAARDRAMALRVSEAEDREEVVAITSEFRDDNGRGRLTACTFLDIVRDAKGKAVAAPVRGPEAEHYDPSVQMLADEPLTDSQKETALKFFKEISEQVGFRTETVPLHIHPAGHA